MKAVQIIVVLISLLFGCTSVPKSVSPIESAESDSSQSVYIVSHGWHTGIVYPRKMLLAFMPELAARFPTGKYLEIGWGDKGFYQAKKITAGLALRAMFWPTDSVVHVVSVPRTPDQLFLNSEIRPLCLGQLQVDSLGRFLANSFRRGHLESIVATTAGIYGDSQFYVGAGNYYVFNTCNNWTAKGLESAGFDINTTSKLTAASIIAYIDSTGRSTNRLQSKNRACF